MVLAVPPDKPLLNLNAVVDVPALRGVCKDLRVLFERYAERSEGTESNPHEGTIMEPVLVAAKS